MFNKFNQIVFIVVIFSLFLVEASAAEKQLTKKQLDAFLVIMTNYIMNGVIDKTAPVFTTSSSITVAENQNNAYRVTVNDISSVTFSISGGDSSFFNINASTGLITFNQTPDFETRNTYSFTIEAIDSSGNSSTQSVTIYIRDLPEVGKPKKTRQLISYRHGDDGYYQKGVTSSYTRNDGTGVVTDHVTGYEWQDNLIRKEESHSDAVEYCRYLSLDGRGWRLPTIQELLTITDRGKYNPTIDTTVFENTGIEYNVGYLTNSDYWIVSFKNGKVYDNAFETSYIRCIR